jgi:ubiquinone/menaquinone biosynthesis C-methylase UbiE
VSARDNPVIAPRPFGIAGRLAASHDRRELLSLAFPGVDYVVDMESQPLPFADRSVEYIFSSHFLEHTNDLGNIFVEIGRVCKDGAQLEIWTPYGWHNDALLPGHRTCLTEEHYLHLCVLFPDVWQDALRSRWVLNEVQYVITDDVLSLLAAQNISVGFAIKHMINIVKEFCVHITVLHHTPQETPAQPFSIAEIAEAGALLPALRRGENCQAIPMRCSTAKSSSMSKKSFRR